MHALYIYMDARILGGLNSSTVSQSLQEEYTGSL